MARINLEIRQMKSVRRSSLRAQGTRDKHVGRVRADVTATREGTEHFCTLHRNTKHSFRGSGRRGETVMEEQRRSRKNKETRKRRNGELLPDCGDQETAETNGSVPLAQEIMKRSQ